VFANLLGNVAKHTAAGTRVDIKARAVGASIEVAVEDNGVGLPAGREEEVFESFARGETQGTRKGAGLGLAISRAIVEAHGGEIRAERADERGARFVVSLPAAA
jgi:two-component system sensor histidine kinase KdpD